MNLAHPPGPAARPALPPAPRAPIRPVEFEVHGQRLRDDYAWLKAANWRDVLKAPDALSRDIHDHLAAENAYAGAVLAGTEPLRERLVSEMRGRIKEDDATVPEADGPFAYYTRHREGGQHPLACRVAVEGGPETVLVDGDHEGRASPFFDLHDIDHSPDHRLVAWSADRKGSELFTIRVREAATGLDLADEIHGTDGEVVWAGDSGSFYYVEVDENHRPARVRRHRLGVPAAQDELIYEEHDACFFLELDVSQSDRFVVTITRTPED